MLIQYVCYSIFTSVSLTRSLSLSFHISPLPFFAAANKEEIKFGTYKKKTAKEKKKKHLCMPPLFFGIELFILFMCVCASVCACIYFEVFTNFCVLSVVVVLVAAIPTTTTTTKRNNNTIPQFGNSS